MVQKKKRYEFWEAFLNYAQQNIEFAKYFCGVKKASKDHWKNFFIPEMDFHFAALQQRKINAIDAQVYFRETSDTYYRLLNHKSDIEREMGVSYGWHELPDKKASFINGRKYGIDFGNSDDWKNLFDFFIHRLLRMREGFVKYSKN